MSKVSGIVDFDKLIKEAEKDLEKEIDKESFVLGFSCGVGFLKTLRFAVETVNERLIGSKEGSR